MRSGTDCRYQIKSLSQRRWGQYEAVQNKELTVNKEAVKITTGYFEKLILILKLGRSA